MSATETSQGVTPEGSVALPKERLAALFEELSELTGQRNAIDGRIVDLVAEIDRDELWGDTGGALGGGIGGLEDRLLPQ